jgi:DNA-binding XRE family transcriptional regulator
VDLRALTMAIKFSGLTKSEVAKRAGIVPGTLSNLINGHRKTCSVETAAAIARALGCETSELFALNMFTGQSPFNTAA